jgi:hypothetical protein
MHKAKAWYLFGRRVWISLALGWFVAILAIILGEPGRAGAFLVCAAIIAEVFHEKGHRRFITSIQPGLRQSFLYREVEYPEKGKAGIEVTPNAWTSSKSTVSATDWPLYHLARSDEFSADGNSRLWFLERTMARVERRVDYSIVATALAGTILWAFG